MRLKAIFYIIFCLKVNWRSIKGYFSLHMQPKMHSNFYFRFDLGGLLFELFDFFVGFDSFFREFLAEERCGGRAWERSWADFEVALLLRDGSLAPPFSGSRRSRGCSRSRLFSLIFCFSPNCRILKKVDFRASIQKLLSWLFVTNLFRLLMKFSHLSSSIFDFLLLFSVTSQSLSYPSPSAEISAPDEIAEGIIRRKCSDWLDRGLSKNS